MKSYLYNMSWMRVFVHDRIVNKHLCIIVVFVIYICMDKMAKLKISNLGHKI